MSMLDGDAHLGHTLFAHLTQNHRHTSLEDVKREFYPFLLHKVQRLAGLNPIGAQHLLQVIFEHSDVSEVLLMRCLDQALQQHIAEARSCMSASYHDLRAKSEAGSARIQTPTPEIESIVKDLLSGRVEEAAAALSNIQRDSHTQLSRGSVPLLPLKDTTNEATHVQMPTNMSELRTTERLSDERGDAEKVKFTMYKNAGNGPGESSVEDIVWTWESEFDSAAIQPKVARVLGLMVPGGNLSAWAATYRSVTRNPRDPEDIRNWTWERFRDELYDSTMYSRIKSPHISTCTCRHSKIYGAIDWTHTLALLSWLRGITTT